MANSPRDFRRFLNYIERHHPGDPRPDTARALLAERHTPDFVLEVSGLYADFLAYQMADMELGLDKGARPRRAPPGSLRNKRSRSPVKWTDQTRALQNQRYQDSLRKDRIKAIQRDLEKSRQDLREMLVLYHQLQAQRDELLKSSQKDRNRARRFGDNPRLQEQVKQSEAQLARLDAQAAELQAGGQHLETVIIQQEKELHQLQTP